MSRLSSTCVWQTRCTSARSVKSLAAIALCASGCFYTDQINQRPSADIIPVTQGTYYRGMEVELDASTYDPEGQTVSVAWRAYVCTDASTPSGCDDAPFYTGVLPAATFTIPGTRADKSPTQALRVILEATDEHGATARPAQEYLVGVADQPPGLAVRKDGRHGFIKDIPIDVYASVTDPADDLSSVRVDWQVFSPATNPAYSLDPLTVTQTDSMHAVSGRVFTAHGLGDWDIQVTATDPVGTANVQHIPITIVNDHAPCLEQWSPAAAPPGDVLPISAATLFQVLYVQDDLDPFPTDPVMGTTTFSWSLLPPGATTRQPLSIVGNSVPIDPASYTPGDILELRVEIADRNATPIPCPDSDPTCSVISDPTCIQRLTWRIEVQ